MNDKLNEKNLPFDLDLENIKQDTITTKIPQRNKSKKQTEIIPNIEDPNEANKEQVLYKCPNCSRKFKREAYAKHVPICARVFQSKKEDEAKKKDIKEIKGLNEKKGNKSKWENQSNELRAMIHNKRAEKDKNNNNKEIKIEIEEPKKHLDNNNDILDTGSPKNSNLQYYKKDGKIFIQCDLCNKKFTKINYESHLNDCKKKYKDKINGTNNIYNKTNIINNINNININNNNQMTRQPMMPAVKYGSNKPKFNMKFKK